MWRSHDHIQAGIPIDGAYRYGIFYGMSMLLGCNDYRVDKEKLFPQLFEVPEMMVKEMLDFNVCKYMRDAAMVGEDRCIFSLEYFNMEEIGMEYYDDYLRENLVTEVTV